MRFSTAQNFTSLSELMRFYADADEIVYKSESDLETDEIAEICRRSRRLVNHLRLHQKGRTAADIAAGYGITIERDAWETEKGKPVRFAECTLHPPKIRLNLTSIRTISSLMPHWAPENELKWFKESVISEVVIALELSRIFEPSSEPRTRDLFANSFARYFVDLPFSPLLYHVLLLRLTEGRAHFSQ